MSVSQETIRRIIRVHLAHGMSGRKLLRQSTVNPVRVRLDHAGWDSNDFELVPYLQYWDVVERSAHEQGLELCDALLGLWKPTFPAREGFVGNSPHPLVQRKQVSGQVDMDFAVTPPPMPLAIVDSVMK